MENKLYKHQSSFLEKNPDKSSLIWSCGTGKTRTALQWANIIYGIPLVICPKALRINWMREAKKWGSVVDVTTKENFRKSAKSLWKYNQIIVDECHNGFLTPLWKSQMSKSLKKYIEHHNVRRILLLTATPYSSSPWQVFNLAYLTGHKWDWRAFRLKFFTDVRMGPRIVPIPKKGCEKELALLVKQIADVVDISECIDVPPQTFETELFDLTPEQQKSLKDTYDPLPIVRFTKIHKLENGLTLTETVPYSKKERILALCEENQKIIVVCRYNRQIDDLHKALQCLKKPLYIIRGDVKDRDSVIRAAEASNDAIVLIQASCSLGYELPSFRIMVFASMDFSFVNWKQICGRTLRINNPQKNLYLRLIGGEMDQAVSDAIDNKSDFNAELYAKRK